MMDRALGGLIGRSTLNDNRRFLPFSNEDGIVTVVAKAAINSICPAQQQNEPPQEAPRHIGR